MHESDHNLGLKILKTPVLPHKILRGAPVQSRPDLPDPKGFLCLSFSVCFILSFFLPVTLRHTHSNQRTRTKKPSSWRAAERQREKWLLSFSPLLTGTLQDSLSQRPPRGGRPEEEEPFTLYCLFATESSYLSSHPLNPSFLSVFTLLSYSHHLPPPPRSHLIYSPFSIFHKVWRLDNALVSELACQRGRKSAEFGERHQRAAELDCCLKVKQKSATSDQRLNSWGWTGSCKHLLTFTWLNDFYSFCPLFWHLSCV